MFLQDSNLKRLVQVSALVIAGLVLAGCNVWEDDYSRANLAYGGSEKFPVGSTKKSACGDWTDDAASSSSNAMRKNHGCAVQSNISAMVADPRDLKPRKYSTTRNSTGDVSAINRATTSTTEIGAITPSGG